MTAVEISTAASCIGEPEVDIVPGRGLRIWPGGRDGLLMLTIGVTDWYDLVAAVGEAIEKAAL
jgi:hypothetical protein